MGRGAVVVSFVLMLHPARANRLPYYQERLPRVEVVGDCGGVWPTARDALTFGLLGRGERDGWLVVVQDDAVLCHDFGSALGPILKRAPESIPVVSFFSMSKTIAGAADAGLSWCVCRTISSAVAVAYRYREIRGMLKWIDKNVREDFKSYDARVALWLLSGRREVWLTAPTLVDHLEGKSLCGNPRRIGGRPRTSRKFIGGGAAAGRDWTAGRSKPKRMAGHAIGEYKNWQRGGTKVAKVKDKGRKKVKLAAQALERLEVEYLPIGDIRPNSYNPNRQNEHDFKLLVRSIREDGFTQPVIVQRDTKVIVDGEHRWRAMQEVGHDKIPVVLVDMTPEQMMVATLRHNRARGSEEIDLTAQVLRDLQRLGALDAAQESLMLDDAEINRLIQDLPAPEALAGDEFANAWVPEQQAKTEEMEDMEAGEITEEVRESKDSRGAVRVVGMSTSAIDAMRDREKKIKAAKSEEEREAAIRDAAVVRISVIYTGDEAAIVREVLGRRPAVTLLELCRQQLEKKE